MTQQSTPMRLSSASFRNMQELNCIVNSLRLPDSALCTDAVSRISVVPLVFPLKKVSACAMLTLPLYLRSSSLVLLPVIGEEEVSQYEHGVDAFTTASLIQTVTSVTSYSITSFKEAQLIKQNNQLLIGQAVAALAFIFWRRYMMKLTSALQLISNMKL